MSGGGWGGVGGRTEQRRGERDRSISEPACGKQTDDGSSPLWFSFLLGTLSCDSVPHN